MKATEKRDAAATEFKYPGISVAMDGTDAVVAMETAGSDAAGAYPITPSTQMGEGWAAAVGKGVLNVNGRRLLFFEPEGEHAAAAVTTGMSMTGLRSTNFSSGQGIAYMHESLYAAVGKRLTYVLNMGCRAMTKHALNVHAGHDDYHAVDDTGFFQLFAKNAQEAADLNLISHRVAELSLTPGICAQDGFLTTHVIESFLLPERELVKEFLGDPSDIIDSPTPAQRMVFGDKRRRIPEVFDFDSPAMIGVVQNQDSYAQGVASQRPFFFDHVAALTDRAFDEYYALTGRRYSRATGYRMEDAEYVILGQGSLVFNAEAAVDYAREHLGIKLGVVNVTMFRPFPSDRIVELLKGRKAVTVLERLDQPLAADLPLMREIRSALSKAVENGRHTQGAVPHAGVPAIQPGEVPDLFSGSFGMGSRDLQPGDLLTTVKNMLPDGKQRRLYYLGIDFVREGTVSAELREWQQKVLDAYPGIAELTLPAEENVNLLPEGSMAVRMHSVGGWGAITMGKNLTMTLFELAGMHVKSNPKYGSEKKGQPTTFYATFAHEPIRTNCELKHVDVVLSPDPNVFRHSNPLDGLAEGGVFVIQSDLTPESLWQAIPRWGQKIIRDRNIRVFHLDAFGIAKAETDEPDLQFRMQGAAFQGAFFRCSPIMEREKMEEGALFGTIHKQLEKKFGHRGAKVVEENTRVIRRGFDEVVELNWRGLEDNPEGVKRNTTLDVPWYLKEGPHAEGMADPERFLKQTCAVYRAGEEPIADPFVAMSAIPAATGIFRDMTGIRFEVPEFIADRCTGCGQCWTQCPDAAIPGLVTEIPDLIRAVAAVSTNGGTSERMRGLVKPLSAEARKILKSEEPFTSFTAVLTRAYEKVAGGLDLAPAERESLDGEFDTIATRLAEFPVARTQPFFGLPERKEEGSGGLLAVTINPYACKGCNLCVEVCPDEALVSIKQTEPVVDQLKSNWALWERLPDTHDRYIQVSDVDEGIGVLHTLLLKKNIFHSMVGGDGSCMGCGEKTGVHLIVAAIEAAQLPRVEKFVARLDTLIAGLEAKANGLLVAATNLDDVAEGGKAHIDVQVKDEDRERLGRISKTIKTLKDLRWRYDAGPTGRGRAALGISNSTGCSSVWGSTYPFNPYPYPWTNHLFQDAPSVAIGLFEGTMRKMADGFTAVRKAKLEVEDAYVPGAHDKFFEAFDWHQFDDDEFLLCPPIIALGGDGAMLDIGFQNASRLMASGKPVRIVVLDTQVYSNTGGQACTSGFHGQISDMATFGKAQHGKTEQRKEMGLIAMAHRNTFVVQTSQASPAHMLGGILRGLHTRRPSVFNIYSPCQAEHGLPDSGSANAAKLALESRAFPYFVFDPDQGNSLAEHLDLDGNPEVDETWPTYELKYLDEHGSEQVMSLPMTVADWAVTEPRFGRHFRRVDEAHWTEDMVPFHEYLDMDAEGRATHTPYVVVLGEKRRLNRMIVSVEMVELAEDRLDLWFEIKQMAGYNLPESTKRRLIAPLEAEFEARLAALTNEYETKLNDLKTRYPEVITRRIAEALVGNGGAGALAGMLASGGTAMPAAMSASTGVATLEAPAATPAPAATAAPAPAPAAEAAAEPQVETESEEGMEPYIDTDLCTTCNECTNLNPKMFAYNADKKAYIKDAHAGTYKELVTAAERCPAAIIHPGTPLDPKEPDLEKWMKRAERFN